MKADRYGREVNLAAKWEQLQDLNVLSVGWGNQEKRGTQHLDTYTCLQKKRKHSFCIGKLHLFTFLRYTGGEVHTSSSQAIKSDLSDNIYLHFQKAFDKVPQRRLLRKATYFTKKCRVSGKVLRKW